MSDDEEDEWVTEVRQSAAGNVVVIHNCFLIPLLTIEMRLLLLNGVNIKAWSSVRC